MIRIGLIAPPAIARPLRFGLELQGVFSFMEAVWHWIYNLLFVLGFVLSAPWYFLKLWRRGNWRRGFGQRFARYGGHVRHAVTNRQVLWLHAVSVGEVNLCTQLIRALEPRLPNVKIVVSTTTTTGMGELEKRLPSHILKIYYPIDFPKYVRKAIAVLHPVAVVLVEAEIWPNFLTRLQRLRIPVFLVNARLSARSYRGYRWLSGLFRPLFAGFAGVGCQNEGDAEKLRRLGCRPEAVHVVGNLKFDAAQLEERKVLDVPAMLRQLGVPPQAKIWVAGSTHPGEEKIVAEAYLRLRRRFPDLFLIVVPRHFERAREAMEDMVAAGARVFFRNQITASTQLAAGTVDCLLVNTTGELRHFYAHADVVFVGKSLGAEGGQNPLEPAALARPVVFGPNMQNFEAVSRLLVSRGGALQVANAAELEEAVAGLLQDEARRLEVGRQAYRVVQENLGAVERTVEMILHQLRQREDIYVADPPFAEPETRKK
jgi:3-deoxy-D-manno-octulosonic-acid transferase